MAILGDDQLRRPVIARFFVVKASAGPMLFQLKRVREPSVPVGICDDVERRAALHQKQPRLRIS